MKNLEEYNRILADLIQNAINKRGLSLDQLAVCLISSRNTIQRWIKRPIEIPLNKLLLLMKLLEIESDCHSSILNRF